jgi:hypothetical protein
MFLKVVSPLSENGERGSFALYQYTQLQTKTNQCSFSYNPCIDGCLKYFIQHVLAPSGDRQVYLNTQIL